MFPAQALAEELKRRQYRVILITDARGMRYAGNFPADDIVEIAAANPNARGYMAKASAAFRLTGGLIRSLQEIKRQTPLAAVGFGGYPSFPAIQAASLMKVPFGIHEQNSLLGRANRVLARHAGFLAHGFPTLAKHIPDKKTPVVEVGNPVRDQVATLGDTPYEPPSETGPFRLLITGGSQGASLFSKVPVEAIGALPNHLRARLEVTHQVPEGDYGEVEAAYRAARVKVRLAPFFDDLPQLMSQAHLLLSRSGASTITEISAIGRPSILVPLGIAMDDHQTVNARILSEADAAFLVSEKEFTPARLRNLLEDAITKPRGLVDMASNARGRVKTGAAVAIADLVEGLIEGRGAKRAKP